MLSGGQILQTYGRIGAPPEDGSLNDCELLVGFINEYIVGIGSILMKPNHWLHQRSELQGINVSRHWVEVVPDPVVTPDGSVSPTGSSKFPPKLHDHRCNTFHGGVVEELGQPIGREAMTNRESKES